MLSQELEATLEKAFNNARKNRHEVISVEHLLLALLDNASVREVMVALDCDIDLLSAQLSQYLDETISIIPVDLQQDTQPTLSFQRILQRAVFHVQVNNKKEVVGTNLFVALFSEQDSHAVYLLNKQNISRLDVVNYLAKDINKKDSINSDRVLEDFFQKSQENLNKGHEKDSDYQTLLRLKADIEKIRNENDAELEKQKQLIDALEKEINFLKENIITNKIIRAIEFKPEHRQAGFSILSYFAEVVAQKYPDQKLSISIEQHGDKIKLCMQTEEGDKEIIEKDLDSYD